MANYFPDETMTFVEVSLFFINSEYLLIKNIVDQAGAILGNPQLALWHSFANEAPEDPNVRSYLKKIMKCVKGKE